MLTIRKEYLFTFLILFFSSFHDKFLITFDRRLQTFLICIFYIHFLYFLNFLLSISNGWFFMIRLVIFSKEFRRLFVKDANLREQVLKVFKCSWKFLSSCCKLAMNYFKLLNNLTNICQGRPFFPFKTFVDIFLDFNHLFLYLFYLFLL